MHFLNTFIRIEDAKNASKKLEKDIEALNKETFDADHYIKVLENILQKENHRNMEIQKEIETIIKDTLTFAQEIKKLKFQEKFLDDQTKVRIAMLKNTAI